MHLSCLLVVLDTKQRFAKSLFSYSSYICQTCINHVYWLFNYNNQMTLKRSSFSFIVINFFLILFLISSMTSTVKQQIKINVMFSELVSLSNFFLK